MKAVSGLVAMNSLMAMCGGIIAALVAGDNDPGFVHNGALAGLVAVCAGSDVMHPIGSLVRRRRRPAPSSSRCSRSRPTKWKIDDVLGVWALHGLCGLWGGIACGIFGLKVLGGVGGVTFASQLVGQSAGAAFGFVAGYAHLRRRRSLFGLRLTPDEERRGADLPSTRSAPIRKRTCAWDVFDPLVSSAESALMSGD